MNTREQSRTTRQQGQGEQFSEQQLAEKAREIRNAYRRAHYNPAKQKEYAERSWRKKALRALQQEGGADGKEA